MKPASPLDYGSSLEVISKLFFLLLISDSKKKKKKKVSWISGLSDYHVFNQDPILNQGHKKLKEIFPSEL